MAENATPEPTPAAAPAPAPGAAAAQARQQAAMPRVQMSYANICALHGTPAEVILNFGLALPAPPAQGQTQPQLAVQINQRVIMSYPAVKRLALDLGSLIRNHEEQFGELKLPTAPAPAAEGDESATTT